MNILISIIIPTYNCGNKIKITLDSILAQNYKYYECIIVDGESYDNTLMIAKAYQTKENFNLCIFSEKDHGIYDAMNKGVKIANGEYVYFLGAGDYFCNDHVLSEISLKLRKDVVYGFVKTENGKIKHKMNIFTSFCYRPICHQAIFSRRNLLINHPFDLQYKYVADQAWIFEVFSKRYRFQYIDLPIAYYDLFGYSSSKMVLDEEKREILDAKKRFFPKQSSLIKFIRTYF